MLGQLDLRSGLGIAVGKWVRNVVFATHVILGESRQKHRRVSRQGERGDCDEEKTSFV